MKPVQNGHLAVTTPEFLEHAHGIHKQLARLSISELGALMKVSDKLAQETHQLIKDWPNSALSSAVLTFRGDIYSGLQAQSWNEAARTYATNHLWILSGLYGILRPYDEISPYRLEMGYPLRIAGRSLYDYWNGVLQSLARTEDTYINLTANEYLRAMAQSLDQALVITPKFLTVSPKTGQPGNVTVHTKIARGAFANWLITQQIEDISKLSAFNALGYTYDRHLSTELVPVFVCEQFGGIGLSTRLA